MSSRSPSLTSPAPPRVPPSTVAGCTALGKGARKHSQWQSKVKMSTLRVAAVQCSRSRPSLCPPLAQRLTSPTHPTLALGVTGDCPSGVSVHIQEQPRAVGSSQGHFGDTGCWPQCCPAAPGMAGEGGKHHEEARGETLCAPKLATRPGWFSCLLPKWRTGRE